MENKTDINSNQEELDQEEQAIFEQLNNEVQEYIEKGYSYAETLLQIGICTCLVICFAPPFNIISVLSITAELILCLYFYFRIMNTINLLK